MQDLFSKLYSQVLAPEIPPLTEKQQQLLLQLSIDEDSPGTIGRDFQTLIDFLQPNGAEVSGIHNLFPLKLLPELNARLSHPIETNLKRPQQKSYPYINGLYLLLRASGLSHVKHVGKKQILVLDEALLQSWTKLNPTERYFTLLEAWMIWGHEEILGERYDPTGNLFKCLRFWSRIPDKGLTFAKYTDQNDLAYSPGIYNIALLDLFGFVSVKSGKAEAGKGWRITRVQRLPFGDAMLQLLFAIYGKKGFVWAAQSNVNVTFGELQTDFNPLFPEWKNNLVLTQSEFSEGIYVFKVSLGKAWRRIAIPAKLKLDWLSNSILDAFDFENDHLYEFRYKDRFGRSGQVSHPYCENSPSTAQVRVGELPLQPGDRMIFLFDFGDNWEFDVLLEEIQPPSAKIKKPKILEMQGEAPKQYWDEEEDWEEDDEEIED
jgi:hypothetical protein